MKTTLFAAVNSASVVVCNGYDIDGFVFDKPGLVRLDCGEDVIAELEDQPIDVDSDGCTHVCTTEGDDADLEFKVTIPIRSQDLM